MRKYQSFDAAFADDKNHQEWMDDFIEMRFEEFFDFFKYVFEEKIIKENGTEGIEYLTAVILWRRSLLTALCRKMNDFGNFADNLTDVQRHAFVELYAKKYMYLILSLTAGSTVGNNISQAWEAQNDACERFGYKNLPVFETLKPHKIFADI